MMLLLDLITIDTGIESFTQEIQQGVKDKEHAKWISDADVPFITRGIVVK
jgi:hypothetical protein